MRSRTHSAETRAKKSEAQSGGGNKHMFGGSPTPETRASISQAQVRIVLFLGLVFLLKQKKNKL